MVNIVLPHHIGINTDHAPDFVFNVPLPKHGRNLVMCFRTDTEILTAKGTETIHPGDCIIHTPEFPLRHSALKGAAEGFRNDWFYVLPEFLTPEAERIGIPFNTIISTGNAALLEPFVSRILDEIYRNDEFMEQSIRQTVSLMLIDIKRAGSDYTFLRNCISGKEKDHYHCLLALQEKLKRHPSTQYDIRQFSSECFLSPERASVLYKKFFGHTPFAELLQARNLLAIKLLLQSSKSVTEIAEECGWKNYRYFDRVFRKTNGLSPRAFRRNGSL